MRIQNNITAMNTHRMYTINNDNVAKSAEKLSSGYRINRAGDDAAGLAISEKMRSQIRGLNMATKNSQDAISLVQTAEGALQETHSMLQRMNELAVQAATGTNEGFDRTQAAKEFEQLKREINDVAEQTNFNNMKILDGSLSYEGYVRSYQTAGVNNTIADNGKTVAGAPDAAATSEIITTPVNVVTSGDSDGVLHVDLSGFKVAKGQAASIKFTDENGNDYVYNFNPAGADLDLGVAADHGTFVGAVSSTQKPSATVADAAGKTHNLTLADDAGKLKLTVAKTADAIDVDLSKWKVTIDTGHGAQAVEPKKVTVTTPNVNTQTGKEGEMEITVDASKVKEGDTFTVGSDTYKIYKNGSKDSAGTTFDATTAAGTKDADGNVVVTWNGNTDRTSDLVTKMTAAIGSGTSNAVAVGETKIKVTASAKGVDKAAEELTFSWGAQKTDSGDFDGRTNTIEFEVSKMKAGDKFSFTISGQDAPVEVEYDGKMNRADFMNYVKEQFAGVANAEQKGNAVIIKDAEVNIELANDGSAGLDHNALRIQVGANENEQLALSIDSMNTKGLGLDDAHLSVVGQSNDGNIDSAGAAITAVKAAINKVSDQRATLGAMQNRLDHKIANLKVTSENLSAAESRIRDVDMASEMTNFTKNNILSQAATAMLAQANALPQNVLSLLG